MASTLSVLCSLLRLLFGMELVKCDIFWAWANWHCLSYRQRQCEKPEAQDKREVQISHVFLFSINSKFNRRILGISIGTKCNSYEEDFLFFGGRRHSLDGQCAAD